MLKGKFCYECGSQGKLREGLCGPCHSRKHPNVVLPEKTEVIQCSKCRLVQLGGRWQDVDWNAFFSKLAGTPVKAESTGLKRADETFTVSSGNEKHDVVVHFNRLVCGVCSRALSDYYVAILQVRGGNAEAERFAESELRAFGRKDPMAFFRQKEVAGGVDFKCGSKGAVRTVAQSLRNKYGAELKSSFKEVTRICGKSAKRTIISARVKGAS